jgi:hypothetical protein
MRIKMWLVLVYIMLFLAIILSTSSTQYANTYTSNISLGNSDNIFVDNTNEKVGIGTTNPSAKLEVQGNIYTPYFIRFWSTDTDIIHGSTWYGLGMSNITTLYTGLSFPALQLANFWGINFQTGGGQMVMRGDTGNVGIGTTSPQALLQIDKNQNAGTEIIINNSNGGGSVYMGVHLTNGVADSYFSMDGSGVPSIRSNAAALYNAYAGVTLNAAGASGNITFVAGGDGLANERMRITSAGNVGIGTTAPGAKLEISEGIINLSGTTSYGHGIKMQRGTNITTGATEVSIFNEWNGLNGAETLTARAYSYKLQNYSGTNWLVINQNGSVGIGTTTPALKLDVDVGAGTAGSMKVGNSGVAAFMGTDNSGAYFGSNLYVTAESWYNQVDGNPAGMTYFDNVGNFNVFTRAANASPAYGTSKMIILNGGNMGIGTETPNQKLQVAGSANITSATYTTDLDVTRSTNIAPINLVSNGGFEAGNTNGWATDTMGYQINSEISYSGTYSLEMNNMNGWDWRVVYYTVANPEKYIGKRLSFSVWMRGDSSNFVNDDYTPTSIHFGTNADAYKLSTSNPSSADSFTSARLVDNTSYRYTGSFIVPEGTTDIYLSIPLWMGQDPNDYNTEFAGVYIDDVIVTVGAGTEYTPIARDIYDNIYFPNKVGMGTTSPNSDSILTVYNPNAGSYAILGNATEIAGVGVYGINNVGSTGKGVVGVGSANGYGLYGEAGEWGYGVYGTSGYIGIWGYGLTYDFYGTGNSSFGAEVTVGGVASDGTGKVVCIKSDGNLGTCSDAPDGSGVCTCG